MLLGALAMAVLTPTARVVAQMPDVEPVRVEQVADKLGVKLLPNSPRELELGKSVTGSIEDTKRFENIGIKTMHEGARVTITCIGPNRIRVEADEMEPVTQKEVVQLQVADDGTLTPAPARPTPPKPPA
jgi:hypothetical protein